MRSFRIRLTSYLTTFHVFQVHLVALQSRLSDVVRNVARMKLLTATNATDPADPIDPDDATRTRGAPLGDFFDAIEGELVVIPTEICDCCRIDPSCCICTRAFDGMTSGNATSTAQVREVDITPDDLHIAVRNWLTDPRGIAGTLAEHLGDYDPSDPDDAADRERLLTHYSQMFIGQILDAAAPHPVGAIVDRSGRRLTRRRAETISTGSARG